MGSDDACWFNSYSMLTDIFVASTVKAIDYTEKYYWRLVIPLAIKQTSNIPKPEATKISATGDTWDSYGAAG